MKTTLFTTLLFIATSSFAQEDSPGGIGLLTGAEYGIGKFYDDGSLDQSVAQQVNLSLEFESSSPRFSFVILPGYTDVHCDRNYDGYRVEQRLKAYDVFICPQFNIPIRDFRISFQFGPGVSYFRKDIFSTIYNSGATTATFSSNFCLRLSYDISPKSRIWIGGGNMIRMLPDLFSSELFSNSSVRVGAAWRLISQ